MIEIFNLYYRIIFWQIYLLTFNYVKIIFDFNVQIHNFYLKLMFK